MAGTEALDQFVEVGAVHLAPLVLESDDGVGGRRGVGVGSARKAAAENSTGRNG